MDDAETVLSWRNDPRVFMNFRSPMPVAREDHFVWFAECLASPGCLILIAEEEQPIGMIRLDDPVGCGEHEVSIIVDPIHQGKGHGSQILNAACHREMSILIAEIRKANVASRRIFEKCGFRQTSPEQAYVVYRRERK